MGVQVDELSGFSCPELVGGAAEFEMIADIKPTRISVSRPSAAKQSDGGFSVVVGREGNSAECVTIPYTIKSTNQDPISGVVFFDADEKIQKEIKVDFDMVPTEAEEEIFTVCFEQPRGGLKTEIEEQEFSITVSQNVEIPVIDVISVPEIARQSDEKALVSLNRAKNQHGNVMIKYGITSDSGFKEQKWEKFEEGQERLDIEVEFPQRPLETSS